MTPADLIPVSAAIVSALLVGCGYLWGYLDGSKWRPK